MGDLIGHVFPGVLFSIAALWWFAHMFQHYFRSKCRNHPPFQSQPWYSTRLCCHFPIEGAVKIAVTSAGILGEMVSAMKMNGPFVEMANAQHMTMYFFFAMNGAMDILKYYNFQFLPDGIEVATGVMAFGAEAFLFYNHLHGRPPIDVQCHMFLFYVLVATILCMFLEVKYRNYVIPSLGRAYFTLMQGTWFIQVGLILYPPSEDMKWDLESHGQMMVVTLIFTWHAAIDFLIAVSVASITWCYMKRCRKLDDVMYRRVNDSTTLPPAAQVKDNVMKLDNAQQLLDSDSDSV